MTSAVCYYDATCRLCTAVVALVRRNDKRGRIRLEPLDSPGGRALAPDGSGSILVVANGQTLVRSDGALAIALRLPLPFPTLAGLGKCVPRPVRDALYDWIAANRYRWFGRCESEA